MSERFVCMDLPGANTECKPNIPPHMRPFDNCPKCRHRVLLHCSDCHIQITGCHCTRKEREIAEEQKKAELWVPGK